MRATFLPSALGLLICSTLVSAQETPPSRNVTGQEQAQGAQVSINQIDTSAFPKVTIFASVAKNSVPLKGLTSADFKVREDEVEQEPLTVVPKLTPLSTVVALDTSGSMKKRLADAQIAAKSFIDSLSPEDKVQVIGFAREVKTLSDDGDRESAKAAIDKTVARGDTALFDALHTSVTSLKKTSGRKAIALLSDGADDDGTGKQLSKHSVDDVLAEARIVNVPIFAIGIGEIDEAALKRLAQDTGGAFMVAPEPSELKALYAKLSEQLAGQYNIYYTSNLPGDGSDHQVQLKYGTATGNKAYKAPMVMAQVSTASSAVSPNPSPAAKATNLLGAENGGQILVAPGATWAGTIDGKEGQLYWFNPKDEAVYGFKDGRAATFDTFSMLIPDTNKNNVKEFELLAGDDSPTGNFKPIGTFTTQNMRMMKGGGFQDFKFEPVTAKYLKVRLLSAQGEKEAMVLYEFRLAGQLAASGGTSAATAPKGINLLDTANGGEIVAAPSENWSKTIDGKEGQLYWFKPGDEAIYSFKGEQPATFSSFGILIPDTNKNNVKTFELFAADDSPTGNYKSIGKFDTTNARMGATGFQDFSFTPVTAKYLKVKLLGAHGEKEAMVLYEFRVFGQAK